MLYPTLLEFAMCIIAIPLQFLRLMVIIPFIGVILGKKLLYYHLLQGSIRHTDNIHSLCGCFICFPPKLKRELSVISELLLNREIEVGIPSIT